MPKLYKKQETDLDVWQAALQRVEYLYKNFDNLAVSFSGGKDSTAVLNVTLEVARKLGRLPVKVAFFDEEAIHPTTIEYVHRIAENPEVDLDWYCLEFKHRNACSTEHPYWYCWEKGLEHKWVRPMPENAITEHPMFVKGMTFQSWAAYVFTKDQGKSVWLTGLRAQESLRRTRTILMKKNDAFITARPDPGTFTWRAQPIYDWSSEDVWVAVKKFGWDYNKTYDIMNKTKKFNNYLQQRVCPPYGEEPIRGLWEYAECFPEMWHKMLDRVPGVATAWRYSNTELYASGAQLPEGVETYQRFLEIIIDQYEKPWKSKVSSTVKAYINRHYKFTDDPIPEVDYHPVSGVSYKYLCRVATKGDFKGRQAGALLENANKTKRKLGITDAQAHRIYGKKK